MEISAAVKPLPQLRRPEAMHAQEECFLHLPAAGAVQGGSSEAQGMGAGVACATHTTRSVLQGVICFLSLCAFLVSLLHASWARCSRGLVCGVRVAVVNNNSAAADLVILMPCSRLDLRMSHCLVVIELTVILRLH